MLILRLAIALCLPDFAVWRKLDASGPVIAEGKQVRQESAFQHAVNRRCEDDAVNAFPAFRLPFEALLRLGVKLGVWLWRRPAEPSSIHILQGEREARRWDRRQDEEEGPFLHGCCPEAPAKTCSAEEVAGL